MSLLKKHALRILGSVPFSSDLIIILVSLNQKYSNDLGEPYDEVDERTLLTNTFLYLFY